MRKPPSSSRSRMPLAISLIAASFISAFFLATFSQSTTQYWVATIDLQSGHQISTGDLSLVDMDLAASSMIYLPKDLDPLGQVVIKNIVAGEVMSVNSVSSTAKTMASSAVPLSIRSVDLAAGIYVGALVDIYWVIDSLNGESPQEPILILGSVPIISADVKNKNFGTDAAITVSVEQTQVLRLLSATTMGRLVVISSNV
ncbi:SAF domain-containing protein [Candidatus Planktophila vernalis]|nr:SAF domain-containing protein [Candidatus Planktophila vernalis]